MPSTSKSQQRLFCMALAVRKGDLPRSKVHKSVLDIVDSDMTNKQIEDFTVVKEMLSLRDYITSLSLPNNPIDLKESLNLYSPDNIQSKTDYKDKDGNPVKYLLSLATGQLVEVDVDDPSMQTIGAQVIVHGKGKDLPFTIKSVDKKDNTTNIIIENSTINYVANYASGTVPVFNRIANPEIFVIIKPGFFNKAGEIIEMFEKDGFVLTKTRAKMLTLKEAQKLYKVHKNEDFYDKLCEYMASAPTYGMIFSYPKKHEQPTPEDEPIKKCDSLKDRIRELWSKSDMKNVIHSSDSIENMWKEASIYF